MNVTISEATLQVDLTTQSNAICSHILQDQMPADHALNMNALHRVMNNCTDTVPILHIPFIRNLLQGSFQVKYLF